MVYVTTATVNEVRSCFISVSYTLLCELTRPVFNVCFYQNPCVTKSELPGPRRRRLLCVHGKCCSYLSDTCKRSVCSLFAVVLDFVPSLFYVPMAIKVFLLSDSLKFSSSSPAVCVAPKHCSILEFLKELWHYFY